jgi:hypothetical protein
MRANLIYSLILIGLVGAGIQSAIADSIKVIPTEATLDYVDRAAKNSSEISIENVQKKVAYNLAIDPEFDVDNHLVGLSLMLHRSGDKADAPNLLYENSNWHGYQPFIFAASDFAFGADKSIYGKQRTVRLKTLGLEIQIKVLKAAVSSIPKSTTAGDGNQFDELQLQIHVRSLLVQ